MNHTEMQMHLSSSVDGEANDAEMAEVLSHLDSCAECRQFVGHAKQIRETIRALGKIELPYDFASQTAQLVERDHERVEEWLGIEPLARNTFCVIAVLVLVMFLFTSFNEGVSLGITEVLLEGSGGDSAATQVLLRPGDFSKNDFLYAVMTK